MKLKIYVVYDSKAEAYMQPFFMRSRGEALRGWQDACNDTKTQFNKFPEDFTLFEIGEYDELTAKIIQPNAHTALGKALEYVKKNQIVDA